MKKTSIFFSFIFFSILFSLFAHQAHAAVIFSDEFTDADSTTLIDHNSDYTYFGNPTVYINSNRAEGNYFGYVPSQTDYCASIDGYVSDANLTVKGRATSWGNSYVAQLTSNGNYELRDDSPGGLIMLDSGNISLATSQAHNLRLCMIGEDISMYVDNDLIATGTSSTFSSGTTYIGGDNSGQYFDNFLLESPEDVKIVVDPSLGTKTVNTPFTVNLKIISNDLYPFNAARADVSVSANLDIIGLATPTSNACNLSYTITPTTSNPTFAGGIFGDSSEACTVYTLTLKPNATGTGTVTLTNGSVKSYSTSSEILDDVENASFTLSNSATPTPTPLLEFAITNLLQTYSTSFDLTGTKLSTITSMWVNGDDANSSYPSATTWENAVTLSIGPNNFSVYGKDGSNNQTATQTVTVNRHILGDINGDGEIDLIDASLFAVDWDKTEDLTYNLSDMNGDGDVNLADLSILSKLIE